MHFHSKGKHSKRTFSDGPPRPLLQFTATSHVAVQHATRRVGKPHLRLARALLLQVPPHAGERAARAGRRDEPMNGAARLGPNLGGGGAIMRLRVGRIVKLVRPYRAARRERVIARLVVVVPRVLVGDRGHGTHVRAEHAQQVDLLLALRVGHVDHAAVAFSAADVR